MVAMTGSEHLPKRQRYQQRKNALWKERSTWITRYKDVTTNILPFSGRYFASDRNKGDKSFNNIYDSTATQSLDILAAGMMSGMTSPARPWFRLATPDKELMEYEPVKIWLQNVTDLMRAIFAKSNTYNALHSLYEELGAFGTGVSILEPNFTNVIHHTVLTAGEYAVATDEFGVVDTLAREYEMTVAQIVSKFVYRGDRNATPDWSVASTTVKNLWDTGRGLDNWVTVNHIIEPRTDRDVRMHDAQNMRFASCYLENGSDNTDRLLRESGYRRFPGLTPRWHVRGGDAYGHGPSFRAMGDIKQLQQEQLRKGQAIDFQTLPPIQVPAERKNSVVSRLPGGVSFVPTNGQPNAGIRSAFEVNLNLQHLLEDIQDVRGRIRSAFYADLFLMLSSDNRRQRASATEIVEQHEEKLLMIGPVLERLHTELLSPKIEATFDRVVEAGILPTPPEELHQQDLKVEFISALAQAQKMVGIGSMDRMIGTVANLASLKQDPAVWDKVNSDQVIDLYSDVLGVDPSMIVADDKVAIIREDRAEQQAAQMRAAAIPAAAKSAKDLSAADTSGKNALTDLLQQG